MGEGRRKRKQEGRRREPPRGRRDRVKPTGARPRGGAGLPRDVVEDVRGTARRGRGEEALRFLEGAVADLERGRPREAAKAAASAKSLAPRSPSAREVLGLALYRSERFREALRELQAYRRLSGRADQNHLIADCHRALGAPEKAVPLAREALAARIPAQSRAEAVVVAGAALADLGRFDEAIGLLRSYRTSPTVARPHDLRVWYVLADVLQRAGRKEEAARAFRRIMRHRPDAFDVPERLEALS